MKIIRVDVVEREITKDDRCKGKVRICLAGGKNLLLDCVVPFSGVGGLNGLNGTFAFEAVKQMRRLPEYAKAPIEIEKHVVPAAPQWAPRVASSYANT